jgi:hypothetical protein
MGCHLNSYAIERLAASAAIGFRPITQLWDEEGNTWSSLRTRGSIVKTAPLFIMDPPVKLEDDKGIYYSAFFIRVISDIRVKISFLYPVHRCLIALSV